MRPEAIALQSLGELLRREHYTFTTVTPETHRRVEARAAQQGQALARDLRDVFGWNRVFARQLLPAEMFELLRAADALQEADGGWRSRVRFATLGDLLCVHSWFPTTDPGAVFFGPDTYRFCSLLARWAPAARRAVDIGCGSGAGGLSIAGRVEQLILSDINPRALLYTEVNAALAARSVELVHSDVLQVIRGELDLIIANPPYMRDDAGRVYRDGGGDYGTALSVRIVHEALPRLSPGGVLIVYTGAPILNGRDPFCQAIESQLSQHSSQITYEELDPDVFGEELEKSGYADVERIAVVGLKVCVPGRR